MTLFCGNWIGHGFSQDVWHGVRQVAVCVAGSHSQQSRLTIILDHFVRAFRSVMADNPCPPDKPRLSRDEVRAEVIAATPIACDEINKFSEKVFKTRGGRMGSGMGVLLEALWAYYVDQGRPARAVGNEGWEIGWLPDHEYNDFACVECDVPWEPATKRGEFFRIEAKSMNSDADESKGHFDQLHDNLGEYDLLLVLIWSWRLVERGRSSPIITDFFIGPARGIAVLRDRLHVARGGSFVSKRNCPDGCRPNKCTHHGEPLNAAGKRERASGPESRRPANVPFAANFGGLMRMLKTRSADARKVLINLRASDDGTHDFISFMHRNFPKEEQSTYPVAVWRDLASKLQIDAIDVNTDALITKVREFNGYMDLLRKIHE